MAQEYNLFKIKRYANVMLMLYGDTWSYILSFENIAVLSYSTIFEYVNLHIEIRSINYAEHYIDVLCAFLCITFQYFIEVL